jgi:DNA-binding transcriptional regulator GbsR (MarR family)
MDLPPDTEIVETGQLDALQRQVVDFFVDGVKVLGLPRSLGEIYGLLFITPEPLSLDDLVARLGISKGSVSQGLRSLKDLGAIRETLAVNGRRTHYEPAIELKRLVGGFIREQVRPHLESGKTKLAKLQQTAKSEPDPTHRDFLLDRISRLGHWMHAGRRILPIVQRFLGQ